MNFSLSNSHKINTLGKGTDVESVLGSDKLGSMNEKQWLPQNQEIPKEDWERTPLSVKQWVESREKQLRELEQRLAQRQAEQQSRQKAT